MNYCILGHSVSINENRHLDSIKIHKLVHYHNLIYSIPYNEDLEEEEVILWDEKNSLEIVGDGEGYYMKSDCICPVNSHLVVNHWKSSLIGCQGFESDIDEDEVDNRDYERLNQSIEFVRRLEQVLLKDILS